MRIARISVDGFGWIRDRQWEPGPGLTLVRGENEAGKSTLLAFIRAVLFGFDRSDPPALAGGRRGGRLDLVLAGGRTVTVERHGDRSGEGSLEVRDGEGGASGTALADLLHGVDRTVFRSVFAFGLGELSNLATLTDEGVASRIYGAGAGSGTADALGLEDAIARERSALFLRGGRLPGLNRILDEIESADARLRARDLPAEYGARRARLAGLERELTELDGRERALIADRGRHERIAAAWEPWTRRLAVTGRLEAVPDPGPMPPDALVRAAVLGASVTRAEEAVAALGTNRQALVRQRDALHPDRSLLAAAGRVEALATAAAGDRARLEELDRAEADLRTARAIEAEACAALGPGWTADRVGAFDASVAVRAAIAGRFRDALEGASRAVGRCEDVAAAVDRDGEAVRGELADLEGQIDALGATADAAADRAARIDEVVAGRRELELLRGLAALEPAMRGLPPRRGRRGTRVPALLVVLAGGAVAGLLAILGSPLLAIAAGAVTAIAAAIARGAIDALLHPAERHAATGSGDALPTALRAAERRMRERLAAAGLPQDASDAAIDAALTAAAAGRDSAARLGGLHERRAWLVRRMDTLRGASESAVAALEAARRENESVATAWRTWLTDHGLDPALGREEAGLLVDAVGRAKARLEATAAAARRVDELRIAHRAHAAAVDALLRDLGRETAPDDAARAAAVRALDAAVRSAARAAEDEDRLAREIAAVDGETPPAERRLGDAVEARARFHASCRVRDDDELAAAAAAAAERVRLQETIEALTSTLVALSGPGDALDRLEEDLRAVTDVATVAAALAAAGAELGEVARRRDAAREEAGALRGVLDEMETSAADTEVRQAREDLRAQGADLADRWAVLTLARALLRRTREQYEREHRPDVIREAERTFAAWTDGRYPSIRAPLGGGFEAAVRSDGSVVPLAGLSRGTAEQLYLAMRLGLAEHFAATADALPLVMDDVLVNFDPARAERAARTIEEVATRHQVLYFTCHPATPLRPDRTIEVQRVGVDGSTERALHGSAPATGPSRAAS